MKHEKTCACHFHIAAVRIGGYNAPLDFAMDNTVSKQEVV